MKINKAIREVMRIKNISLGSMGASLKKTDKKTGELVNLKGNDVSARLNHDNLSFDIVVDMLNVLGYEIVIQEKKQGGRRSDQIVINQKDDISDVDGIKTSEVKSNED